MNKVEASLGHVPQLDGVRAIAVLIVVVAHAGLEGLVPGGFGVTIFFFLSGYLITSLLRIEFENRGSIDLRGFYERRVLRIFPPLYITLVITCIAIAAGLFAERVQRDAIIFDFLFLTNYAHVFGTENGVPIPLWSLAVEEHFYLLFPLFFIIWLARRPGRDAALICLGLCGLVLGARFLTWIVEPEELWRNYYWTHTRIDSILFGSCLALWQNPRIDRAAWKPAHWHFGLALLAVGLTFVIRDPVFRETIRYTIQGCALFVIFSYVLSDRWPLMTTLLSSAPMRWIGLLSYTLYLCHYPIYLALEELLGVSHFVSGVLGLPVSLLYSFVMYKLVERPIAQWRKRARGRSAGLEPGSAYRQR